MKDISVLAQKSLTLTEEPGVYLMKNEDGKIIYVGKAKNLKRRVHSYFSAVNKHNEKTKALVSKINDFEFIVVGTELEALLLENTLIKKHRPHYNILLKDDKGYPYVRLSKGDYPMLSLAHKREGDGAEYYGPFYGSRSAKNVIETASIAFRLPICSNPTPKAGKRPCLNYSIKRCCGLCGGKISKAEYNKQIASLREFLRGDINEVLVQTEAKMEKAAEELDFEMAAVYRDRIKAIRSIIEKQKVSSDINVKGDFINAVEHDGHFSVSVISVEKGLVTANENYLCSSNKFDSLFEFFGEYLNTYYGQNPEKIPARICTDMPLEDKEIVCKYLTELKGSNVRIVGSQNSTDKHILAMALRNANEQIILAEGKTNRTERLLYDLSSLIGVDNLETVEIYDISHLAGTDVVCGMAVCGQNGFIKSKYKKFKISPENAGDDCASLAEAVSRRILRFKNGDEGFSPLPQVIFADGGYAQVCAVNKVVKEQEVKIKVFGLKKDSRHRTKSLVFEDGRELQLYRHPDVFGLCGRMQEEAHRFAVAYHNTAAKKRTLASVFESIEGVGKARSGAIIKHFKSLSAVKKASVADIEAVPGISRALAEKIYEYVKENLF